VTPKVSLVTMRFDKLYFASRSKHKKQKAKSTKTLHTAHTAAAALSTQLLLLLLLLLLLCCKAGDDGRLALTTAVGQRAARCFIFIPPACFHFYRRRCPYTT
jgi:hypothetical protein